MSWAQSASTYGRLFERASCICYIKSQLTPSQPPIPVSPSSKTQIPISTPLVTLSPAPRKPACESLPDIGPAFVFLPSSVQSSADATLSTNTNRSTVRIRVIDHAITNSKPSTCSARRTSSLSLSSSAFSPGRGVRSAAAGGAASR